MRIAFSFILAALLSLPSAWAIPGSAFTRVARLLEMSESVRYVFQSTDEGAELARRLIGRIPRAPEDFRALTEVLERPANQSVVDELASRLPHIEGVRGDELLRAAARRELSLVAGESGIRFVAATYREGRDAFLSVFASRLKVAAVQYPIEGGKSLQDFLAKVERYILEAKAGGAELVVLPELFTADLIRFGGGPAAEAARFERVAQESTPRVFARIKALSQEHHIAVLAGSSPRKTAEGIVNTAQLSFADGKVILQDKLFLTPEEAAWGWKPGHQLQVFDAPWGRTAILICYDSQFPSISSALSKEAPEVILVPSMTGAPGFNRVRWAAQARAVEQHAFVVVTGTVDAPGAANAFSAQAAFITPQDAGWPGILAAGPEGREAVVYGELDLARLRESRRAAGLYAGRDELGRTHPIEIVGPGTK